jgi:hypothetical protein
MKLRGLYLEDYRENKNDNESKDKGKRNKKKEEMSSIRKERVLVRKNKAY